MYYDIFFGFRCISVSSSFLHLYILFVISDHIICSVNTSEWVDTLVNKHFYLIFISFSFTQRAHISRRYYKLYTFFNCWFVYVCTSGGYLPVIWSNLHCATVLQFVYEKSRAITTNGIDETISKQTGNKWTWIRRNGFVGIVQGMSQFLLVSKTIFVWFR